MWNPFRQADATPQDRVVAAIVQSGHYRNLRTASRLAFPAAFLLTDALGEQAPEALAAQLEAFTGDCLRAAAVLPGNRHTSPLIDAMNKGAREPIGSYPGNIGTLKYQTAIMGAYIADLTAMAAVAQAAQDDANHRLAAHPAWHATLPGDLRAELTRDGHLRHAEAWFATDWQALADALADHCAAITPRVLAW